MKIIMERRLLPGDILPGLIDEFENLIELAFEEGRQKGRAEAMNEMHGSLRKDFVTSLSREVEATISNRG